METTVLPRPVPDEMLTPDLIAKILDGAADLIERHGREVGDWWTDASARPTYTPGAACCSAGAIAAAAGYTRAVEVAYCVTAVDGPTDPAGAADPHPAFAALMAWLRVEKPEDVFDWSDSAATDEVVVHGLRDCAAHVRAVGTGGSA